MKTTLLSVLLAFASVDYAFAQPATLSSPKPVKIVTSDLKTYKGMIVDITIDYIVIDLSKDATAKVNSPYYLRPQGNYYRIDVEYIQTAYTKKPKSVGKATLAGAVAGLTGLGLASYFSDQGSDEQFKNMMLASGVGAVVGGIMGCVTGLFIHKTWHINGSSVELAAFRDYYF